MRALVVTQNITVDGSIEMLGDWFDPQGQGDQSDLLEELHRQDRRSDAFLTGRKTFEDLRSYWPKQSDDTSGITKYLNEVRKYVVSSTITDPQWENTTILSGDPVQRVQELKEQQGLDIVVTGSITLCHTLINAGLVDEYRLSSTPLYRAGAAGCFPMDSSLETETARDTELPQRRHILPILHRVTYRTCLNLGRPVQLDTHRDKRALEVSEQDRVAAYRPWAHSMADAERGQGASGLADVPFHRVEPVAAIGDMGDTQTFAGRSRLRNRCGSNAPNGI